jgi:hypothetical protein
MLTTADLMAPVGGVDGGQTKLQSGSGGSVLAAPPATRSTSTAVSSQMSFLGASPSVLHVVLVMILSILASADIQWLVRPHWRNAVAAPVNPFTGGSQIRHFGMDITGR